MTKAEIDFARLQKRLADVTAGKKKLERMLAGDPGSSRAAGWKRRIAEYDESIAGLPGLIRRAQEKVAKLKASAAKA